MRDFLFNAYRVHKGQSPQERSTIAEKLPQKELKGYNKYMQKIRYRLFPGVW